MGPEIGCHTFRGWWGEDQWESDVACEEVEVCVDILGPFVVCVYHYFSLTVFFLYRNALSLLLIAVFFFFFFFKDIRNVS